MSTNKVHSKVRVPFAWENKPGIRKEDVYRGDDDDKGKHGVLPLPLPLPLPPPPYLQPESGRSSPVNLQNIPLPPCAFHPLVSRGGSYKEEEDPFLIAYKKCTNGTSNTTRRLHKKKNSSLSTLSCKHSCSVRDDSIVRISQLPIPKPTKEIIGSFYKFDD